MLVVGTCMHFFAPPSFVVECKGRQERYHRRFGNAASIMILANSVVVAQVLVSVRSQPEGSNIGQGTRSPIIKPRRRST